MALGAFFIFTNAPYWLVFTKPRQLGSGFLAFVVTSYSNLTKYPPPIIRLLLPRNRYKLRWLLFNWAAQP